MKDVATHVAITGEIFRLQAFGGISRYVVELVRELQLIEQVEIRIEAPIYTNRYLREHCDSLGHRGLYLERDFRGKARLTNLINRLRLAVAGNNSDIVHTSFYNCDRLSRSHSKNITTFYDMIDELFRDSDLRPSQKRKCLELSDRCIAISQSTKDDMVELMGADPDTIDVIHLATSMRPPLESNEGERDYLLWVGDRSGYKNFQGFASAYGISDAARNRLRVICAGGPPPTPDEMQAWHESGLPPEQVTHLTPSDDELARLYSNSRALVYLSKYEGFGIPPLEAMVCGCPVLASNTSSIPEVVGDAAKLVSPDSPEEIAAAINETVFDDAELQSLIERGKERASEFSWKRCASETYATYLKAMGHE